MLRALVLWALLVSGTARADGPVQPVAPDRPVQMMINLAGLTDWSTQQPFIDRMKTARPWLGHLPGQWGGVDMAALADRGLLDAQGWPTAVPTDLSYIGTQIMWDLPPEAQSLAGRYVLRFEGDGLVEVAGRASGKRYGRNRVSFDFTPGPGGVEIRIQRSAPANPVRNITVIREDRLPAFEAGAIFNPDVLAALDGFVALRVMDWMDTNYSPSGQWEERPKPDDFSYAWRGIPLELVAELSRITGADPWITLPHLADDAYFRQSAQAMKALLPEGRQVYVELSNEVWNWQFPQANWAEETARARWGEDYQWMQAYGMRSAQMAQIWRAVFADTPDKLILVLSTHTAWLGLEEQALNAPLWQAESRDNPAPYTLFDAYAITGYVGAHLGSDAGADRVRDWLSAVPDGYATALQAAAADMFDGRLTGLAEGTVQDYLTRILPYHIDVAKTHDLQLLMYEGGTHVVGTGPLVEDDALTDFFVAFNYSPDIAAIYSHLMRGWAVQTDAPFMHYVDIFAPSRWGSWGALRYPGDDNPRWQVIQQFRKGDGS